MKERVKKAQEEAAEYEEKMQQTKLELKDLPRGSKDRVTKMKEINMYQQKRGEAKKEIEAAEAELQTFLNPESVPSNPLMRRGGSRRLVK